MKEIEVRRPAAAGQFYPASTLDLKRQIAGWLKENPAKINALACMLPHAGYMYSGQVAAETVSEINLKDKIILIGPNHTGYGKEFSIMTTGRWQTPLGEIEIDSPLAKEILKSSPYLQEDSLAHLHEHSLEVELPILQYLKKDFKIVPIILFSSGLELLKEIGKGIARVIKELNIKDSTLIIASSDMTHYEPQKRAQEKDKQAIEAILELNEDKLTEKVERLNISMCGYAPAVVMLSAAKALGGQKGTLVKYQTSGDVTGDTDSVVGYAGIVIY
ncbi:MAG: AmmeMemoRadiSam system protein B [Candidatus Omnitrophica bacterium]|nr:AmmeMemoRadiSam system protein B [Candidatus Omnitrophota bacterium]MBI5145087.1 AmmeMemoRadiSam system protein B [Candidatus Omnitrophota bacterium]